MAERSTKRPTTVKAYQYDDWICLMCQNLNYSFRKTCKCSLIQAIDAEFRRNKIMTTYYNSIIQLHT
jgi:hypothetical protein